MSTECTVTTELHDLDNVMRHHIISVNPLILFNTIGCSLQPLSAHPLSTLRRPAIHPVSNVIYPVPATAIHPVPATIHYAPPMSIHLQLQQ